MQTAQALTRLHMRSLVIAFAVRGLGSMLQMVLENGEISDQTECICD